MFLLHTCIYSLVCLQKIVKFSNDSMDPFVMVQHLTVICIYCFFFFFFGWRLFNIVQQLLKGYEGRILIFMLYHFPLNFINGSFVASSTCIDRDKGKKEVGATHDFFLLLSRFDQCCFDAIQHIGMHVLADHKQIRHPTIKFVVYKRN